MYATDARIADRLSVFPNTSADLKVQRAMTPIVAWSDASYGCVDWFIYPDAKGETESPAPAQSSSDHA